MPGCARWWNFSFPTNIAVENPASFAMENTVGTLTVPFVGDQLFQVTLCFSIGTPLSMDVCDGSVMDGLMVCACHVCAPVFTSFFKTGILLCSITGGLPPSMLMTKT